MGGLGLGVVIHVTLYIVHSNMLCGGRVGGLGCGYSCNLHIGRRRLGGKRDLGRALHQKKIELSSERNVPRSFLSEKNYKWIFLSN